MLVRPLAGLTVVALVGLAGAGGCSSQSKVTSKASQDAGSDGSNADAEADASQSRCDDGIQNGNEVATDCGGGCLCDPGQPCFQPGDCKSSSCAGGKCQPPNCTDGLKNGAEADVDCGGSACPKCADLKACVAASDCQSSVCSGNICQIPNCSDGASNGKETDVDCGGSDCPKCADEKACSDPVDCSSNICIANKCVAATCVDGKKGPNESDVDCGGACPPCANGLDCGMPQDCQSGVCTAGSCAVPTCFDKVKNQNETDSDCGGTCPPCKSGQGCSIPSNCESGVCLGNVCQAPACNDKVKNGAESDVDCGGSSCPGCLNGQSCGVGLDCASGGCIGTTCGPWSQRFGGAGADVISGVDTDALGNVFITGTFETSITFKGSTTNSKGKADIFVAKLAPDGAPLWIRTYGGINPDIVTALAVDAAGNVIVTGYFNSPIDFGSGVKTPPANDGFVIKLDGSGNYVWDTILSGGLTEAPLAMAVSSSGDVLVAGYYSSASVNFGGATFTNKGLNDAFAVKLQGTNGAHVWSGSWGSTSVDEFGAVGFDAAGNAFLCGRFTGTVNLGGSDLVSLGFSDVMLLKLAGANGAHLLSDSYGAPNSDYCDALAVDSSGNVAISGRKHAGAMDFGGGAITQYPSTHIYLAKLSGTALSHILSKGLGGSGQDTPSAIAFDSGNIIMIGTSTSKNMNLGGGVLNIGGVWGPFVARFSGTTGAHVHSQAFVTEGTTGGSALAISKPSKSWIIGSAFEQNANFGAGVMTSSGAADAYVASLGPLP